MRFLVDENVGPSVALWLSTSGHNAASVHLEMRGMSDREIIRRASEEDRILITCDKDFGDLVFRELRSHVGVVLLRLEGYRPETIIHAPSPGKGMTYVAVTRPAFFGQPLV